MKKNKTSMNASLAAELARHPLKSRFLHGLTTQDRAAVLAAGSLQAVAAHSVIVDQGERADCLYLITEGCARYFYLTPDGKKIMLFWLPKGQIFGGSALLPDPSRYLVSTEMIEDGSVLVWRRSTIRALAVRFPRLLDNALSLAHDYLTWYVSAHTSLVCDYAEQRLARVLVTLSDGIGRKQSGGTAVELTNEQFANMAHITPFTASRILTRWQRAGAITKKRGWVLIRRPELLFRGDF
jgi:CRP-like cAMP-binding protein